MNKKAVSFKILDHNSNCYFTLLFMYKKKTEYPNNIILIFAPTERFRKNLACFYITSVIVKIISSFIKWFS